jgi:SAM-dependent methyltransferase
MSASVLSSGRGSRVDEHLRRCVAELLTHDQRLRGLAVQADVDGGVVHLTGAVDRAAQLGAVRRLASRFAGVNAVWDRVRVGGRGPVALDLGCGDQRQYPENIGLDRRFTGSVAVRADTRRGLPFATASVDRIYVVHLLEHLPDFLPLVAECHRLLRPGGILHVMSPWWRHVNAVADPTHVRYLDVQTIKGICAYAPPERPWEVLHAGCDGASVFADLTPARPGTEPDRDHLARFFD